MSVRQVPDWYPDGYWLLIKNKIELIRRVLEEKGCSDTDYLACHEVLAMLVEAKAALHRKKYRDVDKLLDDIDIKISEVYIKFAG